MRFFGKPLQTYKCFQNLEYKCSMHHLSIKAAVVLCQPRGAGCTNIHKQHITHPLRNPLYFLYPASLYIAKQQYLKLSYLPILNLLKSTLNVQHKAYIRGGKKSKFQRITFLNIIIIKTRSISTTKSNKQKKNALFFYVFSAFWSYRTPDSTSLATSSTLWSILSNIEPQSITSTERSYIIYASSLIVSRIFLISSSLSNAVCDASSSFYNQASVKLTSAY